MSLVFLSTILTFEHTSYTLCAAIDKPAGLSSAQVLRDLQSSFNSSDFFKPSIERLRKELSRSDHGRRYGGVKKSKLKVKLGHGGTLDPGATGVLIVGIGKGTKELPKFLDGTKSYEAVVVFGAATDTYDGLGKVIGRKDASHITRQSVEDVMQNFRGGIQQKPPIFSALRMDGKRLYEYAREGKELPRKIETRPVKVDELDLIEWLGDGSHGYSIPSDEADEAEKEGAMKIINEEGPLVNLSRPAQDKSTSTHTISPTAKRKRASEIDNEEELENPSPSKHARTDGPEDSQPRVGESEDVGEPERGVVAPLAARIRMTVSSGFYVRSLCHDLGMALGSLAFMASLVRTRQSDFQLGDNVFEMDTFSKSEDVWAPILEQRLDDWKSMSDSPTSAKKHEKSAKPG